MVKFPAEVARRESLTLSHNFDQQCFDIRPICRDTHRISTRFFFVPKTCHDALSTKNKPGQGVGVGFCHICHSVKMRQKHLGLLESSRGPPDHVQIDTCLVSDHTYRWGPFVINVFSNLTNSLSPTPEL